MGKRGEHNSGKGFPQVATAQLEILCTPFLIIMNNTFSCTVRWEVLEGEAVAGRRYFAT